MVGNAVTNWKWDGDPSFIKMGFHLNLYNVDFKKKLEHFNCTFLYIDRDTEFFKPSPEC